MIVVLCNAPLWSFAVLCGIWSYPKLYRRRGDGDVEGVRCGEEVSPSPLGRGLGCHASSAAKFLIFFVCKMIDFGEI